MEGIEGAKRQALIVALIEEMSKRRSWCGETHIQKAVYCLQRGLRIPTGFRFVFYKYGPFSFDLRQEIGQMRANGLIEVDQQPYPYGPTLVLSASAEKLKHSFPKTIARFNSQLQFIAEKCAPLDASQLERLSAALYVIDEELPDESVEARAKRLTDLKPHVNPEEAKAAVEEVQGMLAEASALGV